MKITRVSMLIPLALAAGAKFGGAHSATLTVCASGCEHTTIQGAISHASNGDTIAIGKGHYFEVLNTQGKELTLQGVNNRQVVVDANGIGTVITIPGTNSVSISNLTITRGNGSYGGGVFVTDAAAVTVTNSIVISNYSTHEGGGLHLGSGKATMTITGSTIADNQAGGFEGAGVYAGGPNVTIDSSTIARNVALGNGFGAAGIAANGGAVSVNHSSIVDNVAGNGGISALDATVTVQNSTIAGNSSVGLGGGVSGIGGNITLANVVLTRNSSANRGGGIENDTDTSRFGTTTAHTHVTATYIVGNSATIDGGGSDLGGVVVNGGGVVVAGNSPNNCAQGSTCL